MKKNGFAPVIIILLLAIFGVVGYFGYKNYLPKITKVIQTSNVYVYTDPNKIYSVTFPSNWFQQTEPSSLPIGPVELKRANCDKKIEDCLSDIISTKFIENNLKISIDQVVSSLASNVNGKLTKIVLGDGTQGILVDNISANNLIRSIYFTKGSQIVEVTLSNIGDDDLNQFISTFKLTKSPDRRDCISGEQKIAFSESFFVNKWFENFSASGEWGLLNIDKIVSLEWGRDYVPNDKRPNNKKAEWKTKVNSLILSKTTLSDGIWTDFRFFEYQDNIFAIPKEYMGLVFGPSKQSIELFFKYKLKNCFQ